MNIFKKIEKYYKGMNIEEEDPSQRTKYKWSFVKNLDPVEMGNTRDSVNIYYLFFKKFFFS